MGKEALGRVGCGHLVVPGYWRHALQIFMLGSLPESIRQNALADVMKMKETQDPCIQKSGSIQPFVALVPCPGSAPYSSVIAAQRGSR